MNSEDIETLRKIGLTTYEATAYITLASLISATAVEVSKSSQIPRSKIYEVLKSLAEKEFIEIETGRPLKYNIKPPITTINKQKEKLNTELDKLASKLNFIYENEIKQVPAPVWKISGVTNIIQKEIDIIKRSKETISMRIGFLFEDELEIIIKELKKKNETVNINVLISPECPYEHSDANIIECFKKEGINVYEADIPSVKMMIIDGKEMFHTYTKINEDKNEIMPNSTIGVWNQYEDVAKNYESNFKKQLKKIKMKKEE
ncbi:MAG: helix-turn-helix domain-containing protein [Methanobrevibacter sp.]|uniref:TrmB family transcriptional regulator n=1 Tax=Methanobrevibacter sp. TaxID=66852 RepID=UPI0026DFEE20|nr:helix-turn-helix domain-containing protein [Methanobrevibacter sp.]MDO5848742.1 helix-turn-helix domain-containing protein [Methanobrevibacter sp.]